MKTNGYVATVSWCSRHTDEEDVVLHVVWYQTIYMFFFGPGKHVFSASGIRKAGGGLSILHEVSPSSCQAAQVLKLNY